ncbi:MAG TPA: VOC family protein [Acidimicrobiales bacterium]|nr:VOC family protein [Acidimicrobiales bacterium]
MPKPGRPRFNHVAMSVPADLLNAEGRQAIVDFYSEVFGWQELPTETVDRQKLVLMAYTYDQFVFLIAEDEPMAAPRLDHFGMGVATEAELDTFLAKAKAYQARDPRVDIIDKKAEEHPGLRLTSFYVGYLLPLMVEVQLFEFASAGSD